jgi:hypothetical protein
MRLMCSLHRNKYRNFKLIQGHHGKQNREEWRGLEKEINWSCNTYMHGNNIRKLPV